MKLRAIFKLPHANTKLSEGFTLVEVLMALGALMIGVVALWGLHMSSLKLDFTSNLETRAAFRANEMLEQLRSIAMTNFADPALADNTAHPTTDNPDSIFTRTTRITAVKNWERRVVVEVSWPERVWVPGAANTRVARAKTYTVRLTTYIVSLN